MDVKSDDGNPQARATANQKLASGVEEEGGDETQQRKEEATDVEKVVKSDKVLIGKKTSWAVAKAVGEVSEVSCYSMPYDLNCLT